MFPGQKCRESWTSKSSEQLYNLFLDIILLLIPLSIMSLAYFMIVDKLWKGLRREIEHSSCQKLGNLTFFFSSSSCVHLLDLVYCVYLSELSLQALTRQLGNSGGNWITSISFIWSQLKLFGNLATECFIFRKFLNFWESPPAILGLNLLFAAL